MIKINKTTKQVTTDCRTVGEFMTEAAASFIGLEKNIHVATVKVDWEEVVK